MRCTTSGSAWLIRSIQPVGSKQFGTSRHCQSSGNMRSWWFESIRLLQLGELMESTRAQFDQFKQLNNDFRVN